MRVQGRLLLLLSLFSGLSTALLSCAPADPPGVSTAWRLVDLWDEEPTVSFTSADDDRARAAYFAKLSYLGSGTLPDLSLPLEERPQQIRAGKVRCIAQREGTELRYRLTLGEAAYFSFTPLRNEGHDRPFRFHVSILEGSQLTEVLSADNGELKRVASATLTADLSPWEGTTIRLVLSVEPLDGHQTRDVAEEGALWANPVLVERRPLVSPPSKGARPNVVLLTADTLRADALGAWGATPSVTPALDRLAEESEVWMSAISSFNVTNPSFASLMTGLYGRSHGVYDLQDRLAESHSTLAELFAEAGYDTFAIVSVRHLGKEEAGLRQGFSEVVDTQQQLSAEATINRAITEISSLESPYLVWIHLFDPHTPHTPPDPFWSGLSSSSSRGLSPTGSWARFRPPGDLELEVARLGAHAELYRGEVAYMDRQVDRLMGFLRQAGHLDTSIVVFVADHGENLGEHGIRFRHAGLFETTTRVPMMIRWPGGERGGERHGGLAQNVDLFPTLLAAAGLEVPPSEGQSLLSYRDGRSREVAFSEAAGRNGVRIRTETHAYMESSGNPFIADGPYLFELANDPGEEQNLAGRGLPEEVELREALHRWRGIDGPRDGSRPELSAEEVEELRALGYL